MKGMVIAVSETIITDFIYDWCLLKNISPNSMLGCEYISSREFISLTTDEKEVDFLCRSRPNLSKLNDNINITFNYIYPGRGGVESRRDIAILFNQIYNINIDIEKYVLGDPIYQCIYRIKHHVTYMIDYKIYNLYHWFGVWKAGRQNLSSFRRYLCNIFNVRYINIYVVRSIVVGLYSGESFNFLNSIYASY